jgi:hypothetical protein
MVFKARRDPSWSPGCGSPKRKALRTGPAERFFFVRTRLRGCFLGAIPPPGSSPGSGRLRAAGRPCGPVGRFCLAPQAPARAVLPAWLSSGDPAPAGPPLRARVRACGPAGRFIATIEGCAAIGRSSDRKAERPPAGARSEAKEQRRGRTRGGGCEIQTLFAPLSSSSACNSPASNISIMMSLPPTNSPFT